MCFLLLVGVPLICLWCLTLGCGGLASFINHYLLGWSGLVGVGLTISGTFSLLGVCMTSCSALFCLGGVFKTTYSSFKVPLVGEVDAFSLLGVALVGSADAFCLLGVPLCTCCLLSGWVSPTC